ncbi:hypothetical protein P9600_gp20 [Escherichia phage vB_EcoD_Opt212]|uniref:Uncharacterized protein n=1 Tax=Escherichia phage vB_EcoD_Opt212 TaxID=2906743 RepID=A0AAE8Z855_9CAUD|nr:hypothetical protein P9600_gp20 [Escherichia phage vB_EcoD_Opt212]UHS64801.1 hypothetical protein OPT212_20 [Escherichia phage vB_EcoD_Opt212]
MQDANWRGATKGPDRSVRIPNRDYITRSTTRTGERVTWQYVKATDEVNCRHLNLTNRRYTMFEQIVNLITRGVVALETIAKHYETVGAAVGKQEDKKPSKAKKEVVEDDDDEAEDEKPAKSKKTPAKCKAKKEVVEDDDDDAEDEKPAKSKKAPAKGKGKKDADPLAEMRDEIKQYAAIIAGGDDDDANDEFDDLLEAFEIKSIAKLEDDDVEDFHKDLKEIVETYFELED